MKLSREEAFSILEIEVSKLATGQPARCLAAGLAAARAVAGCVRARAPHCWLCLPACLLAQATEDEVEIKKAYKRQALRW